MIGLVELLADLLERARTRSRPQWLLRLAMLGSAVLALAVPRQLVPSPLLTGLAVLALVLGLLFPRGHLPGLLAAVVVLWAAAAVGSVAAPATSVLAMVPVAGGLLGWHWSAAGTSLGRAHTRVAPGVWRRFAVPLLAGAAAIGVGAVLALLLAPLVLPPALTLTGALVLVLVAVVAVVLWPSDRGRPDRRPGRHAR